MEEGDVVHNLLKILSTQYQRRMERYIAEGIYALGAHHTIEFDRLQQEVKVVLQEHNLTGKSYVHFYRLKKNGKLFYSTSYKRALKTNSTYASFSEEEGVIQFGVIKSFVRD